MPDYSCPAHEDLRYVVGNRLVLACDGSNHERARWFVNCAHTAYIRITAQSKVMFPTKVLHHVAKRFAKREGIYNPMAVRVARPSAIQTLDHGLAKIGH